MSLSSFLSAHQQYAKCSCVRCSLQFFILHCPHHPPPPPPPPPSASTPLVSGPPSLPLLPPLPHAGRLALRRSPSRLAGRGALCRPAGTGEEREEGGGGVERRGREGVKGREEGEVGEEGDRRDGGCSKTQERTSGPTGGRSCTHCLVSPWPRPSRHVVLTRPDTTC